ncbi:MAG: hypothetical protein R6U40_11660, partial [Desulfobacterales bacterium]
MGVKKVKPTSPGRRSQSYSTFDEITSTTPEKSLLGGIKKKGGRNVHGRITCLWLRATEFGDEKDRVVIRENGEPTYFASDIAYHDDKFKRDF